MLHKMSDPVGQGCSQTLQLGGLVESSKSDL